jgi:hypothetical protein
MSARLTLHARSRAWWLARAWVCTGLLTVGLLLTATVLAQLAGATTSARSSIATDLQAPAGATTTTTTTTPTDSQGPATIAASFQPDKLGASGALTVTIDLTRGVVGVPPPLRSSILRLPTGLGIEIPHLQSCEPVRLRLLGARGCPAQSRLGVGRALVRAPLGSQPLEESISLWVFLGPLHDLQPTFELLAQGYTPFDERVVLSGTVLPDGPPYGEDLVLSVPAIPTLPLEPAASIASMSLTIGSSRRSARESNTAVEPSRCPSGGFPFAAELTYADGSTQDASATTPCPR